MHTRRVVVRMSDMQRAPSPPRHRFVFWALALVALLISHDLVWLVQIGPAEELAAALRKGGHAYWGIASVVIAAIGLIGAVVVARRIARLRRQAAGAGATSHTVERGPYLVRAIRTWGSLLAVVAIGFAIQENVEHAMAHGHLPGLGSLLGPEYPLALPVIGFITLVGALAAAAVVAVEVQLLAVILATRPRVRAPGRIRRPGPSAPRPLRSLARAHAGRAPPPLLVPA